VEMDAGVVEFSPDERRLVARHGRDTCAGRAVRRTTTERTLAKLRWML